MTAGPVRQTREVEAKFRVNAPFVLPSLTGARTGAADVSDPVRQELRATYWDTTDFRLARAGVTLRHRCGEGAASDGWHLKIPSSVDAGGAETAARDELHEPGSETEVPDALRNLVTPWVRTAAIGPVVTLQTQRDRRLLTDAAGEPLVEVTDDTVSVETAGHVSGRFREIEIEDRGGGIAAIGAVGDVLRTAGAVGGEFMPKVVRALGPLATAEPDPPLPGRALRRDPARLVIRAALRRDVAALIAADVMVRRDEPDAIHKMRVCSRRLRSQLKSVRPLLDSEWATSLRDELRWLADQLGGARDDEVFAERMVAALDTLPPAVLAEGLRAKVITLLTAGQADRTGQVADVLRSERYVVLLERLVDAAWEPMTTAAEDLASDVLPALARREWRQLARAARRLRAPGSTDADWHNARIQAKRLRYYCEAVTGTFGTPAARLARQAEAVQDVLGRQQDAVVAAERLRQIAGRVRSGATAGSAAFVLGALYAAQQDEIRRTRRKFAAVWKRAAQPRHRRWLKA
ncbi:MAG TPA: CYTH and CHAD domain-containing protein [Mycobacteriales bacterium]|nr:CYTH and CHAD domain-containing protein [Mycobacteriales bacterium]